jgi:hypothetical protein
MNIKNVIIRASVAAATLILPHAASAQELLTGETRLACEAIICLSSGSKPDECSPSLQRYFGIAGGLGATRSGGRLDFLKLCPAASDTTHNMSSMVRALANGAGRCDAAYLNATLAWQEQRTVCADQSSAPSAPCQGRP